MTKYSDLKDFPLLYNQTQRATQGVPRAFQIINDSQFLYLNQVDDKGTLGIHIGEINDGKIFTKVLVDAVSLADGLGDVDIPDEIKALKERLRDLTSGISSFQYSLESDILVFSLSTNVFLFSIKQNKILRTLENVFLPKLSPDGTYIALCEGKNLKVFDITKDQYIQTITHEDYTWGQPDFISAEEMGRYASIWFSRDSKTLVSLGYNDDEVEVAHIKNTAKDAGHSYKYPFAGGTNPKLLLNEYEIGKESIFFDIEDEYYVDTVFTQDEAISITLNREQTTLSSSTGIFQYESYRHIDLMDVIPTPIGKASWLHYDIDTDLDSRHLALDFKKIIGTDSLIKIFGFSKSYLYFQILENGFDFKVKRIKTKDIEKKSIAKDCTEIVSSANSPISISVNKQSDSYILTTRNDVSIFPKITFVNDDQNEVQMKYLTNFDFDFETSSELKTIGEDIRVLITKPKILTDKMPLLVYSYGGPSSFTSNQIHRYAIDSKQSSLTQQWIASLGFIVISIDGAGTPIGTISREDATRTDFFEPTVQDQVLAIKELLKTESINENKIAIMGWSFGGYLAAACISKHPEIFKAAVVGAPVSDWALYDTCYTERFISNPKTNPENYERSSLLNKAYSPESKVRLIHGRSDDNVLYINSQKLCEHLAGQGIDVEFVTIDNATHMISNANDAAQLLIDDVLFLCEALELPMPGL